MILRNKLGVPIFSFLFDHDEGFMVNKETFIYPAPKYCIVLYFIDLFEINKNIQIHINDTNIAKL